MSTGGFVLSQQLGGMIGIRLEGSAGGNRGSLEEKGEEEGEEKGRRGGVNCDVGDTRPHNLQVPG